MEHTLSKLREDGTVWPPVTPDPPMPPGYNDPFAEPVEEPDPTTGDTTVDGDPATEPT